MLRVWVVLSILGGVATADDNADRAAKAQGLSDAAFRRIDDADFRGAADLFEEAYGVSKDARFLLNAAVALRKVPSPHHAVETYRRYLTEAGDALTADRRAVIERDIELIHRESASVVVTTAGADATIVLDNRAVGVASKATPLTLLIATTGATLRARRDRHTEAVKLVTELRPEQIVELQLEPTPTTGRVTVVTVPTAARLTATLRGEDLGLAPQTLELPIGLHEIRASRDGYRPNSARFAIDPGATRTVTIRLTANPRSWWQRYRLAVVIGGAVVVGTATVFTVRELTRPEHAINFP